MANGTQPTSARSTAGRFPRPISGASALRARISQLQAQEPDWPETAAVSFVNSNNQLYKQAGNGVTVSVVYAIGYALSEADTEE